MQITMINTLTHSQLALAALLSVRNIEHMLGPAEVKQDKQPAADAGKRLSLTHDDTAAP